MNSQDSCVKNVGVEINSHERLYTESRMPLKIQSQAPHGDIRVGKYNSLIATAGRNTFREPNTTHAQRTPRK